MEEYKEIFERYMKFDKETLAKLLALIELEKKDDKKMTNPYYDQLIKENPYRSKPYSIPPYYGDWVVTCLL